MNIYIRLLPLGLFLLLALALSSGLLMPDTKTLTQPAIVNTTVPEFALQRLDDPSALLIPRNWRGQVVVLNFFASWCEPCKLEHKQLLELAQNGYVRLYGVAWKDEPEKTKHYLTQQSNPFQQVGLDMHGETTVMFGLSGIPESFLIDKQGIVRWKHAGPLTESVLQQELLPLITRYATQQ